MTDKQATLMEKMRKLAEHHPRGDELREKADKLDAAITNYDPAKVLGAWARARKLWCEITGEALV